MSSFLIYSANHAEFAALLTESLSQNLCLGQTIVNVRSLSGLFQVFSLVRTDCTAIISCFSATRKLRKNVSFAIFELLTFVCMTSIIFILCLLEKKMFEDQSSIL